MKITVRIPTEAYAFQEIEFENLEEYKKQLPEFIKVYFETKKIVKQIQKNFEVPFE